jgi:DNA-directed RNA polymerase subunit beta'
VIVHQDLQGLKENIIIGHLIPADTGIYRYNDVDFGPEPEAGAAAAAAAPEIVAASEVATIEA